MPATTELVTYEQGESIVRLARALNLAEPAHLGSNDGRLQLAFSEDFRKTEQGTIKLSLPYQKTTIEFFGLGDVEVVQHDDLDEELFVVGLTLSGAVVGEARPRPFGISDLKLLDKTLTKLVSDKDRDRVIQELVQEPGCLEKEVFILNPGRLEPVTSVAFIEKAPSWTILKYGNPDNRPQPDGMLNQGDDELPVRIRLKLAGFTPEEARSYGERLADYRDIFIVANPDTEERRLSSLIGPTQSGFDRMLNAHMDWLDSDGEGGRRGEFSRMNLSGLKIENQDISKADFSFADLSKTTFKDVSGTGARLNGANLKGATLRNVRLNDSNLMSSKWIDTSFFGVDFSGSNLSRGTFSGANMKGLFRGANLESSVFSNSLIYESDFTDADFLNASMEQGTVSFSNLTGVRLENFEIRNATFASGSFKGASFEGALFRDCQFRSMEFSPDFEPTERIFENCLFLTSPNPPPTNDQLLDEFGVPLGSDGTKGEGMPVSEEHVEETGRDTGISQELGEALELFSDRKIDSWERSQALDILWRNFEKREVRSAVLAGLSPDEDPQIQKAVLVKVWESLGSDEEILTGIYPLAGVGVSPDTRTLALYSLSDFVEGYEEVRRLAVEGLNANEANVRETSVNVLTKLAGEAEIRTKLKALFSDESGVVRLDARKAVLGINPNSEAVKEAFEGVFQDEDEKILQWAEKYLQQRIDDPRPEMRAAGVELLGPRLGDEEIAKKIFLSYTDGEPSVRKKVVEAFAASPENPLTRSVMRMALSDKDEGVRKTAMAVETGSAVKETEARQMETQERSEDRQGIPEAEQELLLNNMERFSDRTLDPAERSEALDQLLVDFGKEENRTAFLEGLEKYPRVLDEIYSLAGEASDEKTRSFGIYLLSLVENDEQAQALVTAGLKAEEEIVRVVSAYSLKGLARNEAVRESLKDCIEDESPFVRVEARKTLLAASSTTEEVREALAGGFDDKSEIVTCWAENSLLQHLEGTDAEMRGVALELLGDRIGVEARKGSDLPPEVVENLKKFSDREFEPWSRGKALDQVWLHFEKNEVRAAILEAMSPEEDPKIQKAVLLKVFDGLNEDQEILKRVYALAGDGVESEPRSLAIFSLSSVAVQDSETQRLVIEGLKAEATEVREASAYTLKELAKNPENRGKLVDCFSDEHPSVQLETRKAVLGNEPGPAEVKEALFGVFDTENEAVTDWAEKFLLRNLDAGNAEMRTVAVELLGPRIGVEETGKKLFGSFSDEDPAVRQKVVEVFGASPRNPMSENILRMAVFDADEEVRSTAATALENRRKVEEPEQGAGPLPRVDIDPDGGGTSGTPGSESGGPLGGAAGNLGGSTPMAASSTVPDRPFHASAPIPEIRATEPKPVQVVLPVMVDDQAARLADFDRALTALLESPRHYREALLMSVIEIGKGINPGKYKANELEQFAQTAINPETIAKLNGMVLTEAVYAQAMSSRAARESGRTALTETVVFNEMNRLQNEQKIEGVIELIEACGASVAYRSNQKVDVSVTRMTGFTKQDAGFVTALMDQGIDADLMMRVSHGMRHTDPSMLTPYVKTLDRIARDNLVMGDPNGEMTRSEAENLRAFMVEKGFVQPAVQTERSRNTSVEQYAMVM